MPIDRGAIDSQLREIGEGERWWENREFRDLPHVLHPDERIRAIVAGRLLGRRTPRIRPAKPWLIVATDQRLLCLRHERFARRQVEFAAGQIIRIDQRSGMRSFQITVRTPGAIYRIQIPKADAFRFVGALAPLTPATPPRRIPPELEPLAWLPGIDTVASLPGVSGIVSRVAMLSPPDYPTSDQVARLEATVDELRADVDQLQQQVAFLEDLLRERATEMAQSPSGKGA